MDTTPMYVATGIATLMIVLGFAALLTQKICLDSRTRKPVSIEVPSSAR